MADFQQALIIANPTAGRGRGERAAQELKQALESIGMRAEVALTTARGDAQRLVEARAASVDLALAVGGDGTLREVLRGAPPEL